MRYEKINNTLFIQNRDNLIALLKPNSLAIFNSNDVIPSNADGTLGFRQNNDLFYLTGIDQEETILVLFPENSDENQREILFIKETNEHIKVWEGNKFTKKEAEDISGIKKIFWTHQFEGVLKRIIYESQNIYLNLNEHDGGNYQFYSRDKLFAQQIRNDFPLHSIERAAPLLHQLRAIKHPIEVELIKKALEITNKGFKKVLKSLKDKQFEFEIEAELTHEFLLNRSRGHAFAPIVASGENACVLHYISNNDALKNGDLILLDFGAEYANYNADITRCLPVNGIFSSRQAEVYQSVLHIMRETSKMIIAGNTMKNLRLEVGYLMETELTKLGLLSKTAIKNQNPEYPLYKKYFPHGVSHYLGLDVHDVGNKHAPFAAGMLFTCEPGIYIPEEKIGIRLENDILITETGNIDLCADIPIEIQEIESLMRG